MWDEKSRNEVSAYQQQIADARRSGSSDEEINKLSSSLMTDMGPDSIRLLSYLKKLDLGAKISRGKDDYHTPSSGKIVLAEVEDVMPFLRSMEWAITTSKYLNDKCAEIETKSHKKIIKKFLNDVLGGSGPYGNVYEECYAGKELNPGEVPDLTIKLAREFTPSIKNWKNMALAREGYIEEARVVASHISGVSYTQENRIFIHGVFDSEKDIEKYKKENPTFFKSLYYNLPIGKDLLLDPFREILSTTNLYTDDDPKLNEFLNKRELIDNTKFEALKKRMETGTPISDEDAALIGNYRTQITALQSEIKKEGLGEEKQNSIQEEIERLQNEEIRATNSMVKDDEMIVKTFKMEDGKMKEKYIAVKDV